MNSKRSRREIERKKARLERKLERLRN